MATLINGFSKLPKEKKITALSKDLGLQKADEDMLRQFTVQHSAIQQLLDTLSENTLSNFLSPYGIAPNFLINNKVYHIPFVTEESSVVAASAKAAKVWADRGGFYATVKSVTKTGQVHFIWNDDTQKLHNLFPALDSALRQEVSPLTESMHKRGGGIKSITLEDKTCDIPGYFQLMVTFDTADAMGANFINSCLETMARRMETFIQTLFPGSEKKVEVVMSILSNYNPECLVEAWVECPVRDLENMYGQFSPEEYSQRFKLAVDIARADVYRAVTHNKGIFNGIDAVAIAMGNDYRAIEAGAHAFASRTGKYQSLSKVEITNNRFRFSLKLPLAVGTVGGITGIHPLTQLSLKILGHPDAKQLMMIMASAGLANNFAAVHALITSGIQKGHMKMHLSNILHQLNATEAQSQAAHQYFSNKSISFSEVKRFLNAKDTRHKNQDKSTEY